MTMGFVKYSSGIEYVKGSLAKPKKVDGHNHGDYLIATHREAETTNPHCTRLYVRGADTYVRSTKPSGEELNARLRFATIRSMVATRKGDLSKVATDQAAFKAQKDNADGAKTLNAYYWKICGQEYDEQMQG